MIGIVGDVQSLLQRPATPSLARESPSGHHDAAPSGQGAIPVRQHRGLQAQRGGGWRQPSPRRQAKRAAPATARRRQGLKPVRGETPQAARCAARKPGPLGRRPSTIKTWNGSPARRDAGLAAARRAGLALSGSPRGAPSAARRGMAKPSPRRQAKRAAPATARRRQGLKPVRGETTQAARCAARKPGPLG